MSEHEHDWNRKTERAKIRRHRRLSTILMPLILLFECGLVWNVGFFLYYRFPVTGTAVMFLGLLCFTCMFGHSAKSSARMMIPISDSITARVLRDPTRNSQVEDVFFGVLDECYCRDVIIDEKLDRRAKGSIKTMSRRSVRRSSSMKTRNGSGSRCSNAKRRVPARQGSTISCFWRE